MTTLPEEAVTSAAIIQVITDLRLAILQDDDEGLAEHAEPMVKAKELIAKLSASPFLPVQGAVKKLEETLRELITDQSEGEWDEKTIEKDVRKFSARILSALEPSAARKELMKQIREGTAHGFLNDGSQPEGNPDLDCPYCGGSGHKGDIQPSAARELALDVEFATIRAMIYCYEGDSAQAFDAQKALAKIDAAIRALSSPDNADAMRERAWYFSAGDTVPEWLEKIEKGNCTLTFGVDVVVTSKDGGYEVRPQGIADNAGPILHLVSHGNVTPEIKGGGNGVAIIGYNRPYDETAEGKIERLKRLLEMALPYVECYDTREHNAEQDAVLTEIDKALSVLTEGDHIADAGKVEGDGNRETLWKSAARDFGAYLASNGTPYAIDYWNECFGPLFSAPSEGAE